MPEEMKLDAADIHEMLQVAWLAKDAGLPKVQGDTDHIIALCQLAIKALPTANNEPAEPELVQPVIGVQLDMAAAHEALKNIPPPMRGDYLYRIAKYVEASNLLPTQSSEGWQSIKERDALLKYAKSACQSISLGISKLHDEEFIEMPPDEMQKFARAVIIRIDRYYESGELPTKAREGWQSIDAAPKDGTVVWVIGGTLNNDCDNCGSVAGCSNKDGVSVAWVDGAWREPFGNPVDSPTHWMPLPQPPKASKEA